jgi:hypothetical protein
MLRLTSYMGGTLVRRDELRDVTTGTGNFRVDIPPGLPVSEQAGPSGTASRSESGNIPLQVACIVGRQAAAGTAKAARTILRRIGAR